MASIFGTDIAALIYGAFDNNLPAVTLHKATTTIGSHGEPARVFADHAGQGVRTRWEARLAAQRGYPADAVKILFLQSDTPAPTVDDEVSIEGQRFRIIGIDQDPVSATWSVAAVAV